LFTTNVISRETRVVFTSWLTDMYEVLSGIDIIALTSLNEGTPLALIEAQFFKKPVVATDVGGVRDCMKDRVTGFLIETNDTATFGKNLTLLVNDQYLRNKMGEEGRKFASVNFSKEKEITETKELYLSLLGSKFDVI
jgi:glycosyltransferase involved in cell wall biosynthesis